MPTQYKIIGVLAGMMLGAMLAVAQTFPVKPVRIVTAEPGGGNDLAARLLAQGLTSAFGQQVLVEAKGGASGALAAQAVSKAAADGYTLLLYSSALWIVPLMKNVSWDPLKDFSPVILAAMAPNVLVVHPSLPVSSVKELAALARKRPGELNYAVGAAGSAMHLGAELFKSMMHLDIVRVPFKGTSYGLTALMAGQVQLMFPAAGGAMLHVKSGRLKALAVTSARATELAPGLPTMASAGLPGFEAVSVYGMFAPAKTPVEIIARLNQESLRVLARGEVKERFFSAGVETLGGSPEEFAMTMKGDVLRWGKVIRDAGIRED
jgi:tripartite-type tricarboxylate transporter receptor subunit TctC